MPTKLSQINLTTSICILTVSAPGVGATFFAGTAGDRSVIFTDLNGIVTLRNPVFLKETNNADPYVEVILQDEDPEKALAYKDMINKINFWFDPKNIDLFDTIIFDDADFLNASAMNHAVMVNADTDKSKTKSKIGKYSFILPVIQDFGTQMSLVEAFIQKLASLCRVYGKNLIFNAHEKMLFRKDPRTKEDILIKIAANFTGRAAPEAISSYFDLVLRITRVGKGDSFVKKFQCHPDDIVSAKDRYSVFKTYEEKLTFPIIQKRIKDRLPVVDVRETEDVTESPEKVKLTLL